MRAVYATVERVMRAADIKATAYEQDEILDALESASTDVDKLVSQGDSIRPAFAPWTGVITFDWPTGNNLSAFKFWLNQFRLHSLTSIVSAGVDLSAEALPWPPSGPPYSAIEIDTDGADQLDVGTGTGQRSLLISGVWGHVGEDRTRAGWITGGSVGSGDTTLTVDAPFGVGSTLLVGTERMIVTDRTWAASGQTAPALGASLAEQSITVSDGTAFLRGEQILVDAERMLVRDVVGNLLIVQRAADGTALAAHTAGTAISRARLATVQRGALGTSAASHGSGAAVSIYRAPALVEQLTVAYAVERRLQETAGYARTQDHIADRRGLAAKKVGGDVGAVGIGALEAQVISAFGRIRHRAV